MSFLRSTISWATTSANSSSEITCRGESLVVFFILLRMALDFFSIISRDLDAVAELSAEVGCDTGTFQDQWRVELGSLTFAPVLLALGMAKGLAQV